MGKMGGNLPSGFHRPTHVLILGVIQFLLALVLIAMDVITVIVTGVVMSLIHTAFFAGCWLGIFYIITSCFGICGGRPLPVGQSAHSRRCCLCTSAVMSLLCIISSAGLFVYHCVFVHYYYEWRGYYIDYVHVHWTSWNLPDFQILSDDGFYIMAGYLAVYLLFTICCLTQTILAFVQFCKIRKVSVETVTRIVMKDIPPKV